MKRIAVLGPGVVGQVLADGFPSLGHSVIRGPGQPAEAARAIEPLCIP